MRAKAVFIFLLLSVSLPVLAQTPIWKNYSSMYNVNGITVASGKVWAATSGGVFSYDPATGDFLQFTTTEDLSNIQATAIVSDSGSYVVVGEGDGSIDELDQRGKALRSQSDIAKFSQISKGIVHLSTAGDTLFACTPFGVVLIARSTFHVLDTYSHFYPNQGSIQANAAEIFNGYIYVAHQFGLSYAPQASVNLAAPDLWKVFTGLGFSDGVNALAVFNGSLYIGTQHGLFYTSDGSTMLQYSAVPGSAVYSLSAQPNSLLINTAQGLFRLGNDGSFSTIYADGTHLNDVVALSDSQSVAGTSQGIIVLGSSAKRVLPPGPATNIVSDLAVDGSGNLWCATSGASDVGVAIMKFDGSVWTNFSQSNTPQLTTNTFYEMNSVGGNEIAAGSWGGPGDTSSYRGEFVLMDGDSIKTFDNSNSPLVGFPDDPKLILVGGAAADASGNIWVINRSSYTNDPILAYSKQDNTW